MNLLDLPQAGKYAMIAADPPWHFRARSTANRSQWKSRRDAENHYAIMGLDDIKAMPVRELAAVDAHLFLWTTGPNLQQAFEVITAWGFRYSGIGFTWVKLKRSIDTRQLRLTATAESDLHVGLGFTTRKNAEFCLLARRGKRQTSEQERARDHLGSCPRAQSQAKRILSARRGLCCGPLC